MSYKSPEEALQKCAAQLTLLKEIGGKIATVLELDSVLDGTARLVQESFGYNHVAFFTVDREWDELAMRARADSSTRLFLPDQRFKLGEGMPGWVGRHGEALLANDVDTEPRYISLYPDPRAMRSELSVPIRVGGEIVGVLDVQSSQLNAFDESDVMVMETLADQVGVAIESARLHEAVQQELTERKRTPEALRESEKRFRAIAETASDAFIIFDSYENIFFWNPAAKAIFGYQAGETRGKALDSIVPTRFREVLREEMKRVVSREEADLIGKAIEMVGLRKDGSEFPIELSLATWSTKEDVFFTVIVRDITARKGAEEALERAREEEIAERKRTEKVLAEQAAKLARANEDLRRKNAELDEFTYMASHDLQEPLRKLTAFSDILKMDPGEELDEDAQENLDFIIDAASRMQRLVQDLLDLSRSGRAAMKREKVSLSECVDVALEALETRVEEVQAEILRDELPETWGDRTMLTQVYQNLIGNALKFIGDNKPVVHLTTEQIDGTMVFGVKDNGIGLKPEYGQQIFAPFKRLHSRIEYKGTGIGLAICRKMVERHGGKIWVESQPKQGAHFKFTLPERRRQEDGQD